MAFYSFTKQERLSGRKEIDRLFDSNFSFRKDIFKVIYHKENVINTPNVKILISVPKRNIKSAVKRNKVKRQLRECYRKNKHTLVNFVTNNNISVSFAVIYLVSEIFSYSMVEEKMIMTLQQLQNVLEKINGK